MPRHAFKFPWQVVRAIKQHVEQAINGLAPERYRQEANYTAALAARLEGEAYRGEYGSVVIRATVFDDRGRNAAESQYGADFAITATISDGANTVSKAILFQSKLGPIDGLNQRDDRFLRDQIRKMKKLVQAPKVMQVLELEGRRIPEIISGNHVLDGHPYTPVALPEYFTSRITTTLDGSTNMDTIYRVKDSKIPRVNLIAKLGGSEKDPVTPPAKKQLTYA